MLALLKMLMGGGISSLTAPLERAYTARLNAQNNTERLEADHQIARLESARAIAVIEAQDRFSATRIGRLLIVVPYGVWWASIFLVSIINPLFGVNFVIYDIPPDIKSAAMIMIPVIIAGDVVRNAVGLVRK